MTAQLSRERRDIIEQTANHIISREANSEHSENLKAVAELALLALAGIDSKPVAWIVHARQGDMLTSDGNFVANAEGISSIRSTPLYAAPPAQVAETKKHNTDYFDTLALDTAREIMCDVNRRADFLGGDIQLLSRIQCRIDEACRAAMLNAGAVTAATVPDGWKLVPLDATRAMIDAARRVEEDGYDAMHKAMLAAAPAAHEQEV